MLLVLEDCKKNLVSERGVIAKENTRSFEHSKSRDRSSKELSIQEHVKVHKTENKNKDGKEKMTDEM